MPTLEDPGNLEEDGEMRIMHFPMLLLFWQGLLPEDSDHDLDYYIDQLYPRVAQFIIRHPYIKQGLSWYRHFHYWGIVTISVFNILIVHPFAIYYNWGNLEIVIDNAYFMFVWVYTLNANLALFYHKDIVKLLITQFNQFFKEVKIDNKEQKAMLHKTSVLCEKYLKIIFLGSVSMFTVGIFIYTVAICLPARKLYYSGWYPYNVSLSPAYEITLVVFGIIICLNFTLANSFVMMIFSFFLYSEVYFKLIENKFRNIREISIKAIEKRKDAQDRPRTALGRNEGQLTNVVTSTGVANQGHRFNNTTTRVGHNITRKRENTKYVISKKEIDGEMCAQLAKCVTYQRDITIMISILERTSHALHYNIYLANIGVYGATLVMVSMVEHFNIRMMLFMSISFDIALFYLVICIFANNILDQCDAVGEAVYACDWFEASMSFKRSMLIVMTRANVPIEFKAPGINPLSVQNFGEVADLAYKMTTTLQGFTSN